MLQYSNEKGFGVITIFVIALGIGVAGFSGWSVLGPSPSSSNSQPNAIPTNPQSSQPNSSTPGTPRQQPSSQQPTERDPATSTTENKCANGRIIVYFKDGVSKTRQQEIISTEKAAIDREYGQFNGYTLKVAKNQEENAARSLLGYAEIKAASPEGCPDSTNSPDAAN